VKRNLLVPSQVFCKVRCVVHLVVLIEVLHFAVEEGLRDMWVLRV
jgi:hypothetical protein